MTERAHPYFIDSARPRIFAHRGFVSPELRAAGIAENTRAAFAAAEAAGAVYLETDCHLTRDGRVVLFHDDDLVRVAGDARAVAEVTYDELAGIMSTRGGLLSLEAALAEFPGARFNIDVKAEAAADPLGRMVAPHGRRVLLTGFADAYRIRAVHAAESALGEDQPGAARRDGSPASSTATVNATRSGSAVLPATSPGQRGIVKTLLAVASGSQRAAARALSGFDALQIPERQGLVRVLTRRLIETAHANGVEVHIWTVNDPDRMRRLIDLGVDGIVTDRTDLAVAALR